VGRVESLHKFAWLIVIAIVLAFLYTPIAITVFYSFNESKYMTEFTGFTLKWYKQLFSNERVLEALKNSLEVAMASSAISTFLGFMLGYAMHRYRVFGDKFESLMYLPVVIPEVPEAVSIMIFFYILGFQFGWITVLIGHTAFNISFAYLTIRSQLYNINQNIEKAARILGAKGLELARKIVIPLASPGLLASALMTFILSFNNFVKTAFTTGPGFETLPLLIWKNAVRGRATTELNALATILLVLSLSLSIIYTRIVFIEKRSK
jgi:spermidine/putrescine transport system permease protein